MMNPDMTPPAGQRWTRNKPTEPGWYWWRDERETRVVEVYATHTGELNASGENFDLSDLTIGEWQGPLTPNEATE